MPENGKQAKRTPLWREKFHAILVEIRDACRGEGNVKKEMDALGRLIEMTHGKIRALEGQLRWADELIGLFPDEGQPQIVEKTNCDAWRESWKRMKERQL